MICSSSSHFSLNNTATYYVATYWLSHLLFTATSRRPRYLRPPLRLCHTQCIAKPLVQSNRFFHRPFLKFLLFSIYWVKALTFGNMLGSSWMASKSKVKLVTRPKFALVKWLSGSDSGKYSVEDSSWLLQFNYHSYISSPDESYCGIEGAEEGASRRKSVSLD